MQILVLFQWGLLLGFKMKKNLVLVLIYYKLTEIEWKKT